MGVSATKKTIAFADLFTLDFWRYLGKATLLFFPAILFLALSYFAFWTMLAAKDVMVMSLEKNYVFGYCLVALVFWAYVTWYSSRLVAKAKAFQQPDDHPVWKVFLAQGPRILAFTCFTIIILAYLQLPYIPLRLNRTTCNILLAINFPGYFFLYTAWDRLTTVSKTDNEKRIKRLQRIRAWAYIIAFVVSVVVILWQNLAGLIFMLICWQFGMVLVLIIRRKIIEVNGGAFSQQNSLQRNFSTRSPIYEKIWGLVLDREDRSYFKAFHFISLAAAAIYLATVFSVAFSLKVGSLPFSLLAFGVLLGLGNALAFLSILGRLNFHFLLICLAILIGNMVEPHYAGLMNKEHPGLSFRKRQHLEEFFLAWTKDAERNRILQDTTVKEYPVYFVLANGGGARSAYWTSSVLARFEDETHGLFSKHLFCLSGASGGSWGNAVFFEILRNKNKLLQLDTTPTPCLNAATSYLKSDFLTYTLARMLGPDIFRYIFPLKKAFDRGAALAEAMEEASGKNSFMYNAFSTGFSTFITQQTQPHYALPVLCINTTRMQDGAPGVISNIDVSDSFFNRRLEVLNLLDEEKDMKLSVAIVLGGSSPYINPAGRIDQQVANPQTGKMEIRPHYFVDGGYFDNSGAGLVNEMIIRLHQQLNTDSILSKYKRKFRFYVLHITNDPVDESVVSPVSPIVNDLASPIKTLMGSYETQTYVNDSRLRNYMQSVYGNNDHYLRIDLYKKNDPMRYPVDWAISTHVVDSINKRIETHETLPLLISQMKNSLQ